MSGPKFRNNGIEQRAFANFFCMFNMKVCPHFLASDVVLKKYKEDVLQKID